jgi:hypothetical protein
MKKLPHHILREFEILIALSYVQMKALLVVA